MSVSLDEAVSRVTEGGDRVACASKAAYGSSAIVFVDAICTTSIAVSAHASDPCSGTGAGQGCRALIECQRSLRGELSFASLHAQ